MGAVSRIDELPLSLVCGKHRALLFVGAGCCSQSSAGLVCSEHVPDAATFYIFTCMKKNQTAGFSHQAGQYGKKIPG